LHPVKLSLFIAGRYLFARKSHNVINVISAISATGMAIGTAALILILSVYNGFDGIIKNNISDLCPDLKIVPAQGKHFVADDAMLDSLKALAEVAQISPVIEENVFVSYADRQAVAKAMGVDPFFTQNSPLASHLCEGNFRLGFGSLEECILGSTLAWQLGARPQFNIPVKIYYPKRGEKISTFNPLSSVSSVELWQAGSVALDGEADKTLLIMPLESLRALVEYGDEVSALNVSLAKPALKRAATKKISRMLGPQFQVLDRVMQNPDLYRMMRYEKMAIFAILIFVIIIVAFNIFGSLSMLIIEKKDDIATLRALGADDSLIKRIFVLEGWLLSLTGLIAGLIVGVGLALLQQHFGLIKLPGNYLIDAYPVIITVSDVLLTAAGVALTGYIVSATARIRTSDPRRED